MLIQQRSRSWHRLWISRFSDFDWLSSIWSMLIDQFLIFWVGRYFWSRLMTSCRQHLPVKEGTLGNWRSITSKPARPHRQMKTKMPTKYRSQSLRARVELWMENTWSRMSLGGMKRSRSLAQSSFAQLPSRLDLTSWVTLPPSRKWNSCAPSLRSKHPITETLPPTSRSSLKQTPVIAAHGQKGRCVKKLKAGWQTNWLRLMEIVWNYGSLAPKSFM